MNGELNRPVDMQGPLLDERGMQEERKRDPGDVTAPLSPVKSMGPAGAAQWSDHGIMRELDALAAKFSPDAIEGVALRAVRRRFEELLMRDIHRSHEMDKAFSEARQANDRLRLARLALGRD